MIFVTLEMLSPCLKYLSIHKVLEITNFDLPPLPEYTFVENSEH